MNSIGWILSKLRFPLKPELGGMSTSHISGFIPTWVSGTAITFSAGVAYNTGSGKPLVTTVPTVLTGLTITPSVWHYAYLYDNAGTPAIEVVTTAPAAPYIGSARNKTGDTSRRFLGAFLGAATGGLFNFLWGFDGKTLHITNVPTAPLRVLLMGPATTPTNTDLSPGIPPCTRTAICLFSLQTGAAIMEAYTSLPGLGTTILNLFNSGGTNVARFTQQVPTDASQNITRWVTANSLTIDVLGYGNER